MNSAVKRRLGSKHNVVIPISLIRDWEIGPHEYVVFEPHPEGALIKPMKNPVQESYGILSKKTSAQEIKKELQKEEELYESQKFSVSAKHV